MVNIKDIVLPVLCDIIGCRLPFICFRIVPDDAVGISVLGSWQGDLDICGKRIVSACHVKIEQIERYLSARICPAADNAELQRILFLQVPFFKVDRNITDRAYWILRRNRCRKRLYGCNFFIAYTDINISRISRR